MKRKILKSIAILFSLFILIETIFFIQSGLHWSIFRDNQLSKLFRLIYNPPDKFWVHRCDTTEKLQMMSEQYSGVEIDAIFYPSEPFGSKFDISHDEQSNVDYPLEDFMPLMAKYKDTKIWFDFKNLNKENAEPALAELEYLLSKYNIEKSRFIIESHDLENLELFYQHGFYTSFFITINEDWFFNSEAGERYFFNELRFAADSGYINAVSFPANYYILVKRSEIPSDLLTWDTHDEKWWQFYKSEELKPMIYDDQVKVILAAHPTIYDR